MTAASVGDGDRKLTAADNPLDASFASRVGAWLSPHNVRRQRRQARADTGLEWVTPHTFRKTVATLLDKEAPTPRGPQASSDIASNRSRGSTTSRKRPSPRTVPRSSNSSAPAARAPSQSATDRARPRRHQHNDGAAAGHRTRPPTGVTGGFRGTVRICQRP